MVRWFLALLFRTRFFLIAYYIAVVYTVHEFILRWRRPPKCEGLRRQDGRTAVVTGGSRGIGLEIVKSLLNHGCAVIIGSSSSEDSRTALEKSLKAEFPHATVEVWPLDLASLQSVKKFAERFLSTGRELHLLINNAGIMFVPYEVTEDGCERHFAVNYLSHCLLTALLLPRLESSGTRDRKSRIVNSASCIHYGASINMKDLQSRSCYSRFYAYMQSKLAQVMFTYKLQSFLEKQGSPLTVNCVHPGVVNTQLMSEIWWTKYVGAQFFKTAAEGAETAIYAALSDDMEGTGGKYLEECKITPSSKRSYDSNIQTELWKETWRLLEPSLGSDRKKLLEIWDEE